MEWTKEQKTVIELRDCNILVSAAAGSGKTAVLVERILSRITDKQKPVNVDEFVIVTFTAAAAAQMRERIGEAIDKAAAEQPENEHLAKQIALLHNAQISTIHSFCRTVIQNYFHRIGIDPSYRLMTEHEAELLRSDVLKEILEESYCQPTESFMDLMDCYKFDKNDKDLEKFIGTLYDKAMSEPWPKEWLRRNQEILSVETLEELEQSAWVRELGKYLQRMLEGLHARLTILQKVCAEADGPEMYLDRIEADMEMLPKIQEDTTLTELYEAFSAMNFGRLSTKRSQVCSPEKREWVKVQRNQVKEALQSLQSDFFAAPPEVQLEDMKQMSGKLLELLHLTEQFLNRFREYKREKALADFNDLEQLALEILVKKDPETGTITRTEAAMELSRQYKEIMIDEYQDSNLVQELLLQAVSQEADGNPNIFMVGDVKQSIYRFRQARPELFTDKLDKYSKEEGRLRRIDLHKNFRSRDIIIRSVNEVFRHFMKKDLGGVEYDEEAALYLGAEFPETVYQTSCLAEVLALTGKDSDFELEAKIIAERIKELTDQESGLMIWDKDHYRLANYRDIVILGRSVKKMVPSLERVLNAEGIPTWARRNEGFYHTEEVSMVVNMLRVLDNPRQDIPLVAVLRSRMFSFDDDELARIKGDKKNQDYYTYLTEYAEEDKLGEKVTGFLQFTEDVRKKLSYAKVADIIKEIYETTKVYEIVLTMPGSVQRGANLDLLIEQAMEFDGTAYQGLFQFVRYLEKIQSSNTDEGEAVLASENDNAVRILTIHASKGLEYPICFLAGMGNLLGGARNQWLHIHSEFGIGTEMVNNELRIRRPTLIRNFLLKYNQLEDLGEELRVLYVAMTRAKEKIIFTGSDKNWNKKKAQWSSQHDSFFERSSAKSYFDMVMPVILQSEDELFTLTEYEEEDLLALEYGAEWEKRIDIGMLNSFDTSKVYNSELAEALERIEQFTYSDEAYDFPVKVSVSDIKKQSLEETETPSFSIIDPERMEAEAPVPKFISREEDAVPNRGAVYGTIWHQAMAAIDFTAIGSPKDVETEIGNLVKEGRLNQGDERVLQIEKLFYFCESELGQELTAALKAGKCYREQPFVLGVPADEVFPDKQSKEMLLVQGIIDAFYEKDGELVLLDYKTDRLEPGGEPLLAKRYQVQMDFYKKALERITGKKVTKCLLYSFSLQKSITLPIK